MSNQSSTTTTTNTPKEELSVAEKFRRDEMLVAKLNSNFKSRVYEWYLKEEDENGYYGCDEEEEEEDEELEKNYQKYLCNNCGQYFEDEDDWEAKCDEFGCQDCSKGYAKTIWVTMTTRTVCK
jgi:DNA-directed RNA polymerase subunit RPC12/RpoP